MSHSYSKIFLHVVIGTKYRKSLIEESFESELFEFVKQKAKEVSCVVMEINGVADHLHLLISLDPKISVSELVKRIKGASSRWINQQNFLKDRFSWQTGYSAFSVSDSATENVSNYIRNQKEHHSKNNQPKD